MVEGVDEPYYCPICGRAMYSNNCWGCGFNREEYITELANKIADTTKET
jgi:hypothetical protein